MSDQHARGAGLTASVLITNYNYGRFLDACLESVRTQTRRPHEIVIVDDGSTDDSRAIIDGLAGDATVILQEQRGQAGALDAAVAASTGDLLCFLDADDVFLPEKIARVTAFFEEHPDVHWARHRLALVDHAMRPLGPMVPASGRSRRVPAHRGLMAERVVTAATSGIVVRRELAMRVFPLSEHCSRPRTFTLARDADALLLGRMVAAGARGYAMGDVLALYRRHPQQMYPSPAHLKRLLERQIEIAEAVASELGGAYGNGLRPSETHKHAMILETLAGAPRYGPRRVRRWFAGLRAVGHSLWDRPLAASRQVAALTFAFVAPGAWLRKFHRGQGWSS